MAFTDPHAFGPVFAELFAESSDSPLGPGEPNKAVYDQLKALNEKTAFAHTMVSNRNLAACCISAAWLFHNYLEESHEISQNINTAEGSFWHGIMHRREPDYGNAKYWFQRVGEHPIYDNLYSSAYNIAGTMDSSAGSDFIMSQTHWDAFAFIDFVEESVKKDSDGVDFCREVQRQEWRLLFEFCYQYAIS